MNIYEKLTIKQLDKQVKAFKNYPNTPKEGWIKAIRKSLKLSAKALAKKMNVSQPSITVLEQREFEKRITLKKLEEIANAFDCSLHYAFIPKASFSKHIEETEIRAASLLLERVQKTMALEDQALTPLQQKEQMGLILNDIKQKPLKKLWNNYDL